MNNVLTINERKFLREAYTHLSNDSYMESMENYIQEGIVSKILQNIAKKALRNNHLVYVPEKYINMFINPHYGDLTKSYKAILEHEKQLKKYHNVIKTKTANAKTLKNKFEKGVKIYEDIAKKLKSNTTMDSNLWLAYKNNLTNNNLHVPTNYKSAVNLAEKYKKYVKKIAIEIKNKEVKMEKINDNLFFIDLLKTVFKNSVKDKVHIISTISHKISNIRSKISMMLSKRYRKATAAFGIGGALAVSTVPIAQAVGRQQAKQKAKQKAIIEKSRKYEKMAKQSIAKKDFRSAIRNHMNSLKVMIAGVISNLNVPTSVKKAMRTTSGKAMAVAGSIAILAVGYSLVKMISRPLIALAMKILNGVASAIKAGKAVVTSLFQNAFRIAKKIIANFKSKFK